MSSNYFASVYPGPPELARRTIVYSFRQAAEMAFFASRAKSKIPNYNADHQPPVPVVNGKGGVISTKV